MEKSLQDFWDSFDRIAQADRNGDRQAVQTAMGRAWKSLQGAHDEGGRKRALLEAVARSHDMPLPAQDDGPLRLLVSGIGRSGTTMIYQQLAQLLQLDGRDINFRYEPYLWNIRSGQARGNSFGMEQLHSFGIHTHLETPIMLSQHDRAPRPEHDRFLEQLFAAESDARPGQPPQAYLAKVIRGSGRLQAYLDRFADLRIVACLRNPYDTINSSLGMFSFFGEEFHSDDRARFRAEWRALGKDDAALPVDAPRAIEWYGAWWQACTEATLACAGANPDRVHLFCMESFRRDKDAVLRGLMDFVGIENEGMLIGLDKPAGPMIKATSLTSGDIAALADQQDFYEREVLSEFLPEAEIAPLRKSLQARYATGKFSFPLAGSDLSRKAPIQLRGAILHGHRTPFLDLATGPRTPLDLPELIRGFGGQDFDPMPEADPENIKRGKTFGVVLTCHNNAPTIVGAVLSCLQQTLPYDRILVVDDKSGDGSRAMLDQLAQMYSAVEILPLEQSLGPAAARHLGIMRIGTDYWTQLDGDDLFWPTKNAAEARAIGGADNAVAFSDILLVTPDGARVQDTAAYGGRPGADCFAGLLARRPQIPRDMTLSRRLYQAAGGYEICSRLYEDWDFKMRLAAVPGCRWLRSDSRAGTVYNRLEPGLSGADPGRHARALCLHFLGALGHMDPGPARRLEAFDAMIGQFGERHVSRMTRAALVSGAASETLAAFARSRRVQALSNEALARELAKIPMQELAAT